MTQDGYEKAREVLDGVRTIELHRHQREEIISALGNAGLLVPTGGVVVCAECRQAPVDGRCFSERLTVEQCPMRKKEPNE